MVGNPAYNEVIGYTPLIHPLLTTVTVPALITKVRSEITVADRYWLSYSPPLFPFQRLTIETVDRAKFTWIQIVRGGAKSYTIARYCLAKGLSHKAKFVFTGPTYRQALHVFNFIKTLIKENSLAGSPLNIESEVIRWVEGSLYSKIILSNGTEFVALPMGDGEKIRGERADVLVCDEFFLMEREMYQSHILPFLQGYKAPGSVGPKLILMTSAEYQDTFAYTVLIDRFLRKVAEENEIVARMHDYVRKYAVLDVNVDDLKAEGYIDESAMDVIEQRLIGATPDERAQALYNKWIGVSGQFFPANLVSKLRSASCHIEHEAERGYEYALSIDVATQQGGDSFVIDVWKYLPAYKKIALVNSYWNKGLTSDEMASKIHRYNRLFNPTWIVMDKGGGGLFVRDSLMKRKLTFRDNTEEDVLIPILEHNENRAINGQRKLVLNRPSDPVIRSGFADERSIGGDYVSMEDVLVHLQYDGLRQALQQLDVPIIIPAGYDPNDDSSDDDSNAVIFDHITESVMQLRHLTLKVNEGADGNKEIARTKVNKLPVYKWKNAVKDGASAFVYGFLAYKIYYKGYTKPDRPMPIVKQQRMDNTPDFTGMVEIFPDQIYDWRR